MKNIKLNHIMLLLFSINCCVAQNITFTDNVFKNVLVSIQANHNRAQNLQNQFTKVDTNNDGEIQISEAMSIKTISLHNSNISSLTGLEHFKKLTYINLQNNQITVFNFPTLIDLENIEFSNNPITSINFSHHPKITSIGLINCPITQLDVSTLPLLTNFISTGMQISTLDFRNNPNLTLLTFKNSSVSTLYLNPNTQLNLTTNSGVLYDCWANNPLTYICAGASQITPITTFLTNCGHNVSNITINSTCALNVNNYDKDLVKIFPNPSSTGIFTIKLPNVHSGEIAVFNTLGQVVYQKTYEGQEITLNLSQLSKGIYLAKITNEKGSSYEEKLVVE